MQVYHDVNIRFPTIFNYGRCSSMAFLTMPGLRVNYYGSPDCLYSHASTILHVQHHLTAGQRCCKSEIPDQQKKFSTSFMTSFKVRTVSRAMCLSTALKDYQEDDVLLLDPCGLLEPTPSNYGIHLQYL